jgi:hypothetical protein
MTYRGTCHDYSIRTQVHTVLPVVINWHEPEYIPWHILWYLSLVTGTSMYRGNLLSCSLSHSLQRRIGIKCEFDKIVF